MNDLVSIIVPVFNTTETLLNKCIESLIGQSHKNIEIIIVDDGSDAATARLCDMISEKDCRISVVHKQNGGIVKRQKCRIGCRKWLLYFIC